jgi:hypothetical protein
MTQETLEEAAARHFNKEDLVEGVNIQYVLQCAFIEGAKYQAENSNVNALNFEIDALKRLVKVLEHQQEKMYSEEDMIAFHKWAYFKNRFEESDKTTKELLSEWVEQFKQFKNKQDD